MATADELSPLRGKRVILADHLPGSRTALRDMVSLLGATSIANATNATLTSEASAVDPQNATAGGPADNVTHGAGNRAADFRNRAADFRGGADNYTAPIWNSTQAGSPNTEEKVVPPPRGNNKMAAQQFPNQTLLPPGLDRRILASALHKLSRLNLDLSSTLK